MSPNDHPHELPTLRQAARQVGAHQLSQLRKPLVKSAQDRQARALALLQLIAEMGTPELDILADTLGTSPEGSFDRRLTGLKKRGLIERRNGRVALTEAGRILAGATT